jgi:hypothetical protein
MKIVFFLCFAHLGIESFAQKSNNIHFDAIINHEKMILGKTYFLPVLKDSIRIDNLKFYISNIKFTKKNKLVSNVDGYYLIDMQNKKSISFSSNDTTVFDTISFDLGIDSATHELGVMDGDLDPTKGMYWTWQSGYIFFKMEGCLKVVDHNNSSFVYHIGGFNYNYPTLQHISFSETSIKDFYINLNLDRFFEKWNCKDIPEIMSPGEKAVAFSKLFPFLFSIN